MSVLAAGERVDVTRLASPKTALIVGATTVLLTVAAVVIAVIGHERSVGEFATQAVVALMFTAVGSVVAFKRVDNRMGWMLLAGGVFAMLDVLGSTYAILDYRIHRGEFPLGPLAVLAGTSWAPTIVLLVLGILLYPDGRLPSRRWRWPLVWLCLLGLAWQFGAFALATDLILRGQVRLDPNGGPVQFDHPSGPWAWWGLVQDVLFVTIAMLVLAWIVSQILGYRRLVGERRMQQKWIISGVTVCVMGLALSLRSPSNSALLNTAAALGTLGIAALAVAIGVGVLKYRLYEIDRIVSRTLTYAVLTALLVGTFVALVELTTQLLPFSSTVGVAASTLVAAALFNPLRKRVQRVVDRRFNRSRYNAEATVAAFAARLRDAVDLDAIQSELIEVVTSAVQPVHATVWLRESRSAQAHRTTHR
jgi:hypothetical protein